MHSAKSKTKQKLEFEAIGTVWSIEGSISYELENKILKEISRFDKVYSRFREDGLFFRYGQKKGTYVVSKEDKKLLDFYEILYKNTDGQMTPLIGSLMEEAGYDKNYSLVPKEPKHPPTWQQALSYSFPKITIKCPVVFDFGAAGKGYLVDILGNILKKHGVKNFCINAGGDILVHELPQIIGLEHPQNQDEVVGTVRLKKGSICGSSGNRRKWDKYHHTINPTTLHSPKDIEATWVIADEAMLADGLATALFFTDPAKLKKHFKFEYAIISKGKIKFSKKFEGTFFSE